MILILVMTIMFNERILLKTILHAHIMTHNQRVKDLITQRINNQHTVAPKQFFNMRTDRSIFLMNTFFKELVHFSERKFGRIWQRGKRHTPGVSINTKTMAQLFPAGQSFPERNKICK